MRADGSIVIGTKLETKRLEKELNSLKSKLSKQEQDLEITSIDYEKAQQELNRINQELEKRKNREQEIQQLIAEQKATMEKTEKGSSEYQVAEKRLEYYQNLLEENDTKLIKLYDDWDKQYDIVSKIETKMEGQQADVNETRMRIEEVNSALERANGINLDGIKRKFEGIGNSLEKISRKVSRVGLQMVGIRSIASMLHQSFNRVLKRNPELQKAMEKIKAMFDVLVESIVKQLEPFLPKILPLVAKLLTIIYEIAQAIMSIDLDSILTAIMWILEAVDLLINSILKLLGLDFTKQTDKFAKDLKNAKGEAKELKKQLMGFDEMNVLNDSGGTNGLSGTLNVDINWPDDSEFKKKVEKLKHYWDVTWGEDSDVITPKDSSGAYMPTTLEILADQAKGKPAIDKYWKYYNDYADIYYNWIKSQDEEGNMWFTDPRTQRQIHLTYEEYRRFIDFMINYGGTDDRYWHRDMLDNLTSQLKDYENGIKDTPKEAIKAGIELERTSEKIGEFAYYLSNSKPFQQFKKFLDKNSANVKKFTWSYKNGVYTIKTDTGEAFDLTTDEWYAMSTYIETKTKEFEKIVGNGSSTITSIIEQFTADNKDTIKKALDESTITYKDGIYVIKTATGQTFSMTEQEWATFTRYIGYEAKNIKKEIETNTDSAVNYIKSKMGNLPDWLKNNLVDKLKPIFKQFGINIGDLSGDAFKEAVNKMLASAEKLFRKTKGFNLMRPVIKSLTGFDIYNLPRLAKGGIINQPGRGVYVGGAIAGERGREGIIPLTDSQQMALLGREIAKNIVINLDNKINVDGRQLARYTSQVMNDMNFASNGGVI